jgi:hypothetical protein
LPIDQSIARNLTIRGLMDFRRPTSRWTSARSSRRAKSSSVSPPAR